MKQSVAYVSMLVFSITSSARANAVEVCNSVAECRTLIQAATLRIEELGTVDRLGPLAGRLMSHRQAEEYCRSLGRRLPTIEELVNRYNPRALYPEPIADRNLTPIYHRSGGREQVLFYYDQPSADTRFTGGIHSIWSGTSNPNRAFRHYVFEPWSKRVTDLYSIDPKEQSAVRCFK